MLFMGVFQVSISAEEAPRFYTQSEYTTHGWKRSSLSCRLLSEEYLDDDSFHGLQLSLMGTPGAGDPIPGTGGLRKLRFGDARRGKGKRGGLRVIYYYWTGGPEFWLFTLYDKDEMDDLTPKQREMLKERVKGELRMRRRHDEKARPV